MGSDRRRATVLLRDVVLDRPANGDPLPEPVALAVVELAAWHGVVSLVRASALRQRLDAVAALLDAQWATEQTRRMTALHDLHGVAQALDGLPWAVVKGPVLSELVYRERGRRSFGDLDVLVHPSLLGDALDALDGAGAELVDRNFALALRQGRGELTLRLPGGTALDLHWHLVNDARTRDQLALDTVPLLQRAREVQLGGVAVRTMDPLDAAVHVLVHAALSGGHRLIWVRDIRESLVTLRLSDVLSRAADLGCELPVRVMLRRAGVPPRPPRSLWEAGLAGVGLALRPGRPPEARPTGVALMAATRGTTAASVGALRATLREKGAWHRAVGAAELAQPSDDEDRAEYLAYASGTGSGHPVRQHPSG